MKKLFKSSIIFSISTAMLITTASASFRASQVKFEEKSGKMSATAYVHASSGNADGNLIIAKYDADGSLKEAKIQQLKYSNANLAKNQENYFTVSQDAESGCTYKAFIWEGDNNTPVTLAASESIPNSAALLSGITVDGTAISGFSADTLSYDVTVAQGSVVPIVKGIVSDNSVYTTTSYAVSGDKQSATATVSASFKDRTVQYTVNIACTDDDGAVADGENNANFFKNLQGGAPGSKAATDYSNEVYCFNSVASEFAGCDYFVSRRYTTDKTANIAFTLSSDADVYVLTNGDMTGFDDYTKSATSGTQIYTLKNKLVTMLQNAGIEPTYADALLWQGSYADGNDTASIKALADKYNISTDKFTNSPGTKWVIDAGKSYDTQYSKRYTAGEQVSVPADNGGTSVLVVVKPVRGLTEHVTDFKQLAAGKSYEEYCSYIGVTPDSIASETTKIPSAYKMSKFTVGADLCGTNSQRKITSVNELSGFENAYFIAPDMAISNDVNSDGWISAAFYGRKSVSGDKYSEFEGKSAKWFEFKVNKDCEVILLVNDSETNFFGGDAEWTHTWQDTAAYTALRNSADTVKPNRNVYVREYSAGDTVELYNDNSGFKSWGLPYITIIRFK